jgi:hypothetical protein
MKRVERIIKKKCIPRVIRRKPELPRNLQLHDDRAALATKICESIVRINEMIKQFDAMTIQIGDYPNMAGWQNSLRKLSVWTQ